MSVVERALGKVRGNASSLASAIRPSTPHPAAQGGSEVIDPARKIVIDRHAMQEAGYLPESGQDRRFANQYRQIKRPLLAAAASSDAGQRSKRLIMMASALPGDGKTFTSINLALSMARERDTTVLLVDVDVPKPHVTRLFGVEQEKGLQDALCDSSISPESLVLPTDINGLSILPAGTQNEMAAELIASARMVEVVDQLLRADPRRVVVFDSSPLLVSAESRALAEIVGQIVLVVRAMRTPRQAVLDALAQLGTRDNVQLVLNQGRPRFTQGYYGQGEYGSYGDSAGA
jgi:protein-tyrosine kinase